MDNPNWQANMATYRFDYETTETDAFEATVGGEDGMFYLVIRDSSRPEQGEVGLRFVSKDHALVAMGSWLAASGKDR